MAMPVQSFLGGKTNFPLFTLLTIPNSYPLAYQCLQQLLGDFLNP